jgi:GNAT superfamily N-acetyltransferase
MMEPNVDIRIVPLDASLADGCEAMTFPRFRHLLLMYPAPRYPGEGDRQNVHAVGVVAMRGRQPAGLCLAAIPENTPAEADLLSIFVVPDLRRRGLATDLLASAEAALVARGVERADGTYMTGKESIAALERVLAKRGWEPPVLRTVTVRFTPDEARTTPWYGRNLLPRGAEIVPWQAITAEEKQRLFDANAKDPWIAEGLEPWAHERLGFEPESSVAMRFRGELVGWVINHRVSSDTVRFTLSFMRPDLARRAAILALYTASIEKVGGAGYAYCMFITPVKYEGMVDFIINRCKPWIGYVGETRGVSKALGQG